MQAKNARLILDLLGHFSLNEIRSAGTVLGWYLITLGLEAPSMSSSTLA